MSSLSKLPKDREHLVLDNINLVHHIIHKYFHIHNSESDLYQEYFQEGCLGLVQSAIRFDPTLGFKFATFAASNIDGSIRRYQRDRRDTIKMPRDLQDIRYLVMNNLELGMTVNEVADELGIDSSKVAAIYALSHIKSLDYPLEDEDGGSLSHEVIPDNTSISESISDYITEESVSQTLEVVKKHMHLDHHRDIYEEYVYSLLFEDYDNAKQNALSSKYKVSQAQVSRILERGNKLFLKYYLGKDVN